MGEDFRSLYVTTDGPNNYLAELLVLQSNLQSFLGSLASNWSGRSYQHLVEEEKICITHFEKLQQKVRSLKDIVELINYHIRDLNEKERLEEENRRLYPDLYWYDSDGDQHTDYAVKRQIDANKERIRQLIIQLNQYVEQIKNITGGA